MDIRLILIQLIIDEVEEKRIKIEIPMPSQVFHMPGIPLSAPGVPFIPPLCKIYCFFVRI